MPKLSPSGRLIAAISRTDDTHYALILIDLQARSTQPLIKAPYLSVLQFWWKSDELLVAMVQENLTTRTYRAVNLRTKKVDDMKDLMPNGARLLDRLPDDPDHMLVGLPPDWSKRVSVVNAYFPISDIARLNLRKGQMDDLEQSPPGGNRWLVNRAGELVGVWCYNSSQWYLDWRRSPKDKWQRIEHPKGEPVPWEPVGVAPDQHRFVVYKYKQTEFIRTCLLDPATGVIEEVPGPAGLDVDATGTWGDAEKIAVVRYDGEGNNLRFLDPEAEEVYGWLGAIFPGVRINCASFSHDDRQIIVRVSNTQNPGVYYLVDRQTRKATPIGVEYTGINPNVMVPSREFHLAASDGLSLTGRITLPARVGKPPLVLIVGPGVNSRAPTGFDLLAQFFANRGYAAAYVNHRGTAGFGRAFGLAGDLQITTGMGRDLVEGVRWLADQGLIDSKRVALFANGPGGLLALLLAENPGVFRTLVAYNPPLDLSGWQPNDLLERENRSDSELMAAAGGQKAFESYLKTLDSVVAVGQLTVPAFFYFPRLSDNLAPANIGKLESALKQRGQPYQLVIGNSRSSWNSDDNGAYPEWKDDARIFDEIGAFLDKNL